MTNSHAGCLLWRQNNPKSLNIHAKTLANQNSIPEEEQIEVRKCMLSFGAESFVFQVDIQKFKDQDIYNYNFACCFVWV